MAQSSMVVAHAEGIVEVLLLIAAFALTWLWFYEELSNGVPSWHAIVSGGKESLTIAGWWMGVVSVPLLLFMLFRWAYKVIVWYSMLWSVSRLDIRVNVCHPDLAGGLGFLGDIQAVFGIVIFAVGSMVASTVGYKLQIENADPTAYATMAPILAFVIFAPLFFLVPLFFFTYRLFQAKEEGILEYGIVASCYTRSFESKWAQTGDFEKKEFIGHPDIQSLASIMAAFENVRRMRVIPFDIATAAKLGASAVGPMIPLFLNLFPQLGGLRKYLGI